MTRLGPGREAVVQIPGGADDQGVVQAVLKLRFCLDEAIVALHGRLAWQTSSLVTLVGGAARLRYRDLLRMLPGKGGAAPKTLDEAHSVAQEWEISQYLTSLKQRSRWWHAASTTTSGSSSRSRASSSGSRRSPQSGARGSAATSTVQVTRAIRVTKKKRKKVKTICLMTRLCCKRHRQPTETLTSACRKSRSRAR